MSLIGEMRNRIVIQTLGGSTDAGGGQSSSFSTLSTMWAKAENLSGAEVQQVINLLSDTIHQSQKRIEYLTTQKHLTLLMSKILMKAEISFKKY
jgi:head-tail adaptor